MPFVTVIQVSDRRFMTTFDGPRLVNALLRTDPEFLGGLVRPEYETTRSGLMPYQVALFYVLPEGLDPNAALPVGSSRVSLPLSLLRQYGIDLERFAQLYPLWADDLKLQPV